MTDNQDHQNQTKLHQPFKFWFTFFKKKEKQMDEFEDNLKEIGTISTAEEFWGIYQHMKRPTSLTRGCEFFLFKKDIKPMWECEANHKGGRFVLVLKKHHNSNKIWEELLISFIMLETSDAHLNGVVLNVRSQEVHISIWTTYLSPDLYSKSINWLKASVDLPQDINIEYKLHPTQKELAEMQTNQFKDNEEKAKINHEEFSSHKKLNMKSAELKNDAPDES